MSKTKKSKWSSARGPSSLRHIASSLVPVRDHLIKQAEEARKKSEELVKQAAKSRG